MKFQVPSDVLADSVAWAARTLPTRPSSPVLSGILITATDSGLELSTFDYETSAKAIISAEIFEPGETLVSGRLLADICRSFPAKNVEVTLQETKLVLTCGSARFSLPIMPVSEYPALPNLPEAKGEISSAEFATSVTQAVTASGRDDMLPVLTGVRLEFNESNISMLATDRFRLSSRDISWSPAIPGLDMAALVPAKVLSETAKSLTTSEKITISLATGEIGDGMIGFSGMTSAGYRQTTTRLLDGDFPKVRSLFPENHTTVAKINRQDLIDAVKRVSLVAERNTAVQLKFENETLVLDAGSGDDAMASESIDVSVTGDDIITGFNPQFLLDGLNVIETEYVELGFTQPAKPVVITPLAANNSSDSSIADFKYLLMPRRLS